jgi:hypothetical protein
LFVDFIFIAFQTDRDIQWHDDHIYTSFPTPR